MNRPRVRDNAASRLLLLSVTRLMRDAKVYFSAIDPIVIVIALESRSRQQATLRIVGCDTRAR
jgi:hypothetical protein